MVDIRAHAAIQALLQVTALAPHTFDVRSFGAKGDGVADDTLALESAFAAIASGGQLIFPANHTFRLSSGLTTTASNVTIHGYGASVLFDTDSINAMTFSGSDGVTIKGLHFNAAGVASNMQRTALRFTNHAKNVTIQDCTFERCVGECIFVADISDGEAYDYTVRDCRFIGTLRSDTLHLADVRYLIGGGRIRHLNNTHLPDALFPSAQGVAIAAGTDRTFLDVLIDGNVFEGHQWRGITISDEDPDVTFDTGIVQITNNTIKHVERQAIKVKNLSRVIVRGNYLEDTDNVEESTSLRGAINVHSGSHFLITDNMIFDGKAEGILIEGGNTVTGGDASGTRRASRVIANNIIEGCAQFAIMLAQRTYDVALTSNVSRNCKGHILLYGQNGAAGDHVSNVSISGGASHNHSNRHITAIFCDELSISGGTYKDSADHGMAFISSTNMNVSGVSLLGAGVDGLRFESCNGVLVTGNSVLGSSRYGVADTVANPSADIHLLNNKITGSATAATDGVFTTNTGNIT